LKPSKFIYLGGYERSEEYLTEKKIETSNAIFADIENLNAEEE
jgi:hypothetical protein